jgi:hypothetical protein
MNFTPDTVRVALIAALEKSDRSCEFAPESRLFTACEFSSNSHDLQFARTSPHLKKLS